MTDQPKNLYNNTSFASAEKILDSGKLRLYNIRNQFDRYELHYGGEISYNVLGGLIKKYNNNDSELSRLLM